MYETEGKKDESETNRECELDLSYGSKLMTSNGSKEKFIKIIHFLDLISQSQTGEANDVSKFY
jgi:hypothetical protein